MFYLMLFALGWAISSQARADQAIVFGGWSSHSDKTYTYKGETRKHNENNYTLGYGRSNYYIAVTKLSYYNWGVVAYYDWAFAEWKNTTLSLRVGVVYGYHNSPHDIMFLPIVLPTITQRLYGELYFQASILATDEMYVATGNLLYKF